MTVAGAQVQIDLTEKFESNEEIAAWIEDFFPETDNNWLMLPQVGSKTALTMIRKKEVKLVTMKYW